MTLPNGTFYSAGICAAIKTSKVSITVQAKTDITCKSAPVASYTSDSPDTLLGQTIELLMWNR